MLNSVWTGGAFFVAAVLFSSFVEYWFHRFMHGSHGSFGTIHREHHAAGEGQGVLLEFWDYFKPSWPIMLAMFLVSVPAGVGWFAGCFGFAWFSAFAHQLQHDNPTKCFWMPMPVHYVHHRYKMWHYNFGLAVDWWDYVFRTYRRVEWRGEVPAEMVARGWKIKWR